MKFSLTKRALTKRLVVAALNCDEALLTVLYRAGGNPVLLESIPGLWQRCRLYKIRGAQRAHKPRLASSSHLCCETTPRERRRPVVFTLVRRNDPR